MAQGPGEPRSPAQRARAPLTAPCHSPPQQGSSRELTHTSKRQRPNDNDKKDDYKKDVYKKDIKKDMQA